MGDKLMWSVEVDDKASGTISKIDKEVKELTGSTKDLAKETEASGKSSTSAMGALSQLGLAAQGLQTIYNSTVGTIKNLVSSQLEQLQVDQQLSYAFQQRGLSAVEASEQMAIASGKFAQVQKTTIFGDEASARALTTLLHVIDDVDQAYEDYSTTLDVAAMSGRSLEQVASTMAKARTGDINGLRQLNVLRKDEIELLNAVEDASARAELAIAMVAERTKGAAEAVDGNVQAMAQWDNDWGDAKQSIGEATLALGGFGRMLLESLPGINRGELEVGNISLAFSNFAGAIAEVAEELPEAVGRDFDVFVRGLKNWKGNLAWELLNLNVTNSIMQAGYSNLAEEMTSAAQAQQGLNTALREQPKPEPYVPSFDMFSPQEQARLRIVEQENKAQAKRDEAAAKVAGERAAQDRRNSLQRIELAEKDLQILWAIDDVHRLQLERDRSILAIKQRGLSTAEEELLITLEQERTGSRIADMEAEKFEDEQKRNNLAIAGLNILTAKDELTKAILEREKALLELGYQSLTVDELALENAQIEARYQETLAQIEQDRIKERERAEAEAHRARMEALREEIDEQRRLSSIVSNAFSSMGEHGSGFGNLITQIQGVTAEYQTMQAQGMAANAALAQSVGAGAHATTGFLEQMGLDFQWIAGIRAGIETASSISAFAMGNIPSGIAHGSAAAIFGAQAAGVGAPSAGSSKGSSAGIQSSSSPGMDKAFDSQKRAHLEALREHQQGGREVVQVIDQRGSNFFERDAVSRRRATQMMTEDRRLSIGGRR